MSEFDKIYDKIASTFNLKRFPCGVGLPFGKITRDGDIGFYYTSVDGKLHISYDGNEVVFENESRRLKIVPKTSEPVIKNRLFYLEKPIDPDPVLDESTDEFNLRDLKDSLKVEGLWNKKFYFRDGEVTLTEKQYVLTLANGVKIIFIRQTGELVVDGVKYKVSRFIPLIEIHGKYAVLSFADAEELLKKIKSENKT